MSIKIGDRINLYEIEYEVYKYKYSDDCYFLQSCYDYNGAIFDKLDIDKESFTKTVLGYCLSGSFPECKTLEDLEKLINALKEEIKKKENKLPEKWYFKGVFKSGKSSKNTKTWEFFNDKFSNNYVFYEDLYYLSNGDYRETIPEGYTEITFEELENYLTNQEMKTYKISSEEAKEIFGTITQSCSWKKRLAELWGMDIMLGNDIVISEDILQEGLKDANKEQKKLINKYILKEITYSWEDLEYGQAVLTEKNEIIAKTFEGWVDLKNLEDTYCLDNTFSGKLVTPKIIID